jgi:DNA-binding response OmpR family regulator
MAEHKSITGGQDRAQRGQIKVLMVDDNEDAVNALDQVMRFYGYQTVVAYTGRDALRLMDSARPDVAILDLAMPEISGFDLAQRFRETRTPDDLLLIALTAWGDTVASDLTSAAGFDFHFVKPGDPAALSALIEEEDFRRRVGRSI